MTVSRSEPLTPSGGVRTGTVMTAAKKIVFQGEPGANSHLVSRDAKWAKSDAGPVITLSLIHI